MPAYLDLGTRMLILVLCAMSLDILVGYCGLVTLGHAAFFGIGAYAAGIFALRASAEPLAGLLVGGAAATPRVLSGAVLLRSRRLTLIMLSLATVLLLQETANKLGWLTGGADGLQGITMGPVAGCFAFDLFGRVWYVYAAVVLARVSSSSARSSTRHFGKSLVGHPRERRRACAPSARRWTRASASRLSSPRRWPAWPERCRRRSPNSSP